MSLTAAVKRVLDAYEVLLANSSRRDTAFEIALEELCVALRALKQATRESEMSS